MKIRLETDHQGPEIVALEGDLDFHASPEVRRELARLADRKAPVILINLQQVGYIDSSGLATFIELFQKIRRYGGKLVLFNLSPGVRSVFEIAKLDSVFRLAGDEREAIALAS